MTVVYLLLVGVLQGVLANHLYDDIPAEYEELVKLEHLNGDNRLRRDSSEFPHLLEYDFTLKKTKRSLRLKRNTYIRDYIPLTLHSNGVNKRLTGYEQEFSKSAYYMDGDSGAAVFLHCEDLDEACSMYGTFHDEEGTRHVIHPSEKKGFHHVKRAPLDAIDMSNDVQGMKLTDKTRIQKYIAKPFTAEGVVQEHTIEISFFLDDSIYPYFLDKFNGNAVVAMKWLLKYYVQLANEMHLRFHSVEQTNPYFKINILLNEVIVMRTLPPWFGDNLIAPNELKIEVRDSFSEWQFENKDNYTQYDHALMITRRLLVVFSEGEKYTNIIGVTFFDGVCANPLRAVSVNRDGFEGMVGHVSSHELGHNIGAWHDGSAGCDDRDMRVMGRILQQASQKTSFNTWFFSDCSVKQFMYFFEKVVGKPSCTMETLNDEALEEQLKLPAGGESYSLDEQCHFSLESDAIFIGSKKKVCSKGLVCLAGLDVTYVYPFHHTKCGKRKWCDHGMCVPKRRELPDRK